MRDDDRRALSRIKLAADNSTTTSNGTTQVFPVVCLCQQYSVCGCDDNSDSAFLQSLLPNNTAQPTLNDTLIRISDVNGTRSIVLNGTLPNGTTASGGTDDPSGAAPSRMVLRYARWWSVLVMIIGMIWFL